MAALKNVSSFDQTEANLDKTPNIYNEFMYDNESNGGILSQFDDSMQLFKKVKADIDDLNKRYNSLMKIYDEFTDFDQAMNSIIRTMNRRIELAENAFLNIVSSAQQTLKSQFAQDDTLMADINSINSMLSKNNVSLDNNGSSSDNQAYYRDSSNSTKTENKHVNNIVTAYAAAAKIRAENEKKSNMYHESYDDWVSGR